MLQKPTCAEPSLSARQSCPVDLASIRPTRFCVHDDFDILASLWHQGRAKPWVEDMSRPIEHIPGKRRSASSSCSVHVLEDLHPHARASDTTTDEPPTVVEEPVDISASAALLPFFNQIIEFTVPVQSASDAVASSRPVLPSIRSSDRPPLRRGPQNLVTPQTDSNMECGHMPPIHLEVPHELLLVYAGLDQSWNVMNNHRWDLATELVYNNPSNERPSVPSFLTVFVPFLAQSRSAYMRISETV